MGNTIFIPSFFIVTGFLIDPFAFARSLVDNFGLAAGSIGCADHRQRHCCGNRRSLIQLHQSRGDDDVVTHAAAGRGDACRHARRVPDPQCDGRTA